MQRTLKSLLAITALSQTAHAKILPDNALHRQDNIASLDGISELEFNDIIRDATAKFRPIFRSFGVELVMNSNWNDTTVNARASQSGMYWHVSMYGGLARRPEVTRDGFALVICHEIGHHLAGFPFYSGSTLSTEGQADYYATHTCAPILWGDEHEENAQAARYVPASVKADCDESWPSRERRNLCYRTALASKSLASLLGALNNQVPSFETKSLNVVSQTYEGHPHAQCRLDTYLEGGLCNIEPDPFHIPGKNSMGGPNSLRAEMESAAYVCSKGSESIDPSYNGHLRPQCWYKDSLTEN